MLWDKLGWFLWQWEIFFWSTMRTIRQIREERERWGEPRGVKGREIFRFSEVFRQNRGIIIPWGYNEKLIVGCLSKTLKV